MLPLSKEAAYRKMVGEAMIIIDVCPNYSQLPTAADVLNLKAAGVGGAIVGGEVVDLNQWRDYIAAYRDLFLGVYAFVEFDGSTASIDNGLAAIAGTPCKYFGVDIENEGTSDPAANLQIIGNDVARVNVARPDVETLAYTAPWWWRAYAGGSTETFGCRGWISGGAYYSNPDESLTPPLVARMPVVGGWDTTNTAFWQYQASVNTAGINSDRNVRVMEGEMTPQERAEYDQKIANVFGTLNGKVDDLANGTDAVMKVNGWTATLKAAWYAAGKAWPF